MAWVASWVAAAVEYLQTVAEVHRMKPHVSAAAVTVAVIVAVVLVLAMLE